MLVETSFEGINLLFALDEEKVLDVQVDEFLSVFFGYEYFIAVLFQVLSEFFAEKLVVNGECAS